MRRTTLALATAVALGALAFSLAPSPGQAGGEAVTAEGIGIPPGYRDWKLISVAHEAGSLNDLRAILGNDVAAKAAKDGTLPFPDGSVVARLAWDYTPLPESAAAFGEPQSHVAGLPKNGVQFMVKDSKRFAATGGWGYAQFNDGKPGGVPPEACHACHQFAGDRDFVFNRHAP